MKRFWMVAASICGALVGQAGAAAGNAEAGATKAVVCQACHGANGNSTNPQWPSLAGLGADYIVEQLQEFKEGKRNNPIMMPMAAPLSADDMADLAAYFSSLPNTGLEADPALLEGRRNSSIEAATRPAASRRAWPAMVQAAAATSPPNFRHCAARNRSTSSSS